ncbi:hypothetical protein D6D23_05245 [Aureobasidium pullulans]|nr:hypothetical protein D6D23_05245 [Aureobasidium pullulans]THZ19092.1 hypothetical protein D6C89_07931 [Aureobasidium pullulans]
MSLNNLLHNYRSALLVWWAGLLSARPTAPDGLIEDLQCFIRGEDGNRTTSLPSKASSMDQKSGNVVWQTDELRPERENLHLDPVHLDPVLATLRDRGPGSLCMTGPSRVLAQVSSHASDQPLHKVKSSRFAIFHLIERRKQVSNILAMSLVLKSTSESLDLVGANSETKMLPYLPSCQELDDQDVQAPRRSSPATR